MKEDAGNFYKKYCNKLFKKELKIGEIFEKNSINCHKPVLSSNRFRIYHTIKLI